jgi:hypothetical protein
MSLNANQLITLIDDNCGTTSSSYPTATKVRDINLALDKFWSIALQASGIWHFDDSNHTDYPILTTNIYSGQRDYAFTTDENGNIILEIYRVMVAGTDGIFYDLEEVDQNQKNFKSLSMVDGQNLTGKPTRYNKTSNGIFLDVIPDYDMTNGLKIFIDREASYFTTLDTFYTSKKPGFAGIFHEYLALRPSYQYAYRKGFKNAKSLQTEMLIMEDKIEEYYSKRGKDQKPQIIINLRSSR